MAPTAIREQNAYYRVKFNETVELPCVIENRRDASVIWQYSKSRIPETLSIGYFYYRKDFRIRVVVNSSDEHVQSWNLQIRKLRLEDEGYYLCKVTAEPETLKRAIYLKVEVDMNMRLETPPPVSLGTDITIVCNTSYQLTSAAAAAAQAGEFGNNNNETTAESTSSSRSGKHSRTSSHHHHHYQHQSHPRLMWFKDGQRLYNLQAASQQQLMANNGGNQMIVGLNNLTLNQQLLDIKIEYHARPVLWSRLHVRALKPTDMGVYTCVFRNQSISTEISLDIRKLL